MAKLMLALVGLLLICLDVPAHARTCYQQAQTCARLAAERGNPQNAPKCLSAARLATCQKTCTYTGNDGRQFAANGDCNRR